MVLWLLLAACSSNFQKHNVIVRGEREGRFADLNAVGCLIGLDTTGLMTWEIEFYVDEHEGDELFGLNLEWRDLPTAVYERHAVPTFAMSTITRGVELFGVEYPARMVYSFGDIYRSDGDAAGVTTRAVHIHELRIPDAEITSQFTQSTTTVGGYLTDATIYCIDAQAVTQGGR